VAGLGAVPEDFVRWFGEFIKLIHIAGNLEVHLIDCIS
jgi:hypothetical protein